MSFALGASVGSAAVLGFLAVFTNMSRYPTPLKDSSETFFSCYHVYTLRDCVCSVKERKTCLPSQFEDNWRRKVGHVLWEWVFL